MDLLKLLMTGGNSWIVIAVVAFFLLRSSGGGKVVDPILDILRKLLNRPDPKSEALRLGDPHDCCSCLIEMASHLEKQGHTSEAETLRGMLPKLAKGHRHE